MGIAKLPLRVVVIGCGRVFEQCHLPALRTLHDIDVVGLVDSNVDRLNTVADRLAVERRYTDYRVMLKEAAVDVVAVCTPPHLHAEIGLAVLDVGKHLFMEKPLALSLLDADRLVNRAAASSGKALAGFNLRWHRLVREARTMITGGSLGRLETMHTMFASRTGFLTPGSDWRHRHEVGGSVLFDLGIHHFDLWRVLMQSEIEEVSAHYRADDPAVECATVSATMGNGVLITASFARGLSDRNEVEIFGRDGELQLSCYRFDSLRLRRNSEPQGAARDWSRGVRRAFRNLPHAVALWRQGGDVIASYRAQWYHFIDAIRNDTPVECTFEEARSAVRVALATIESAAHGQPVRVAHAAGAITPLDPAERLSRTAG